MAQLITPEGVFEGEYHPEHNPRPATEIKPGVTLLTKSGRQIGNAIVVKRNGHTSSFPGSRDYIALWLIETDFGNRITVKESEIHSMWELGFEQEYLTWWDRRFESVGFSINDEALGRET